MSETSTVSVEWLREHQGDESIRVVDASWHLPATGRDALAEFMTGHIPGAVYFSIDECSAESELPHMLPSEVDFSAYVGQRGISEHHHIVVYDTQGLFSAARVWWMFRHFGASRVSVLDGGMPAWKAAELPLEQGAQQVETSVFTPGVAKPQAAFQVVDAKQVLEASESGSAVILDARSYARFTATEKEVRPGLRSGHIPQSINFPYAALLDGGVLKSAKQLQTLLGEAGVNTESPIITSCGSGVTAAIICLALERVGVTDVALYDGSWTEWGALQAMPVEASSQTDD